MVSLIDPKLRASMLRSGAGQGLMSLGAGLMSHGVGGGPQALERGISGLAQGFDPMRMYQAQMIQDQLQEAADKRQRRQLWDETFGAPTQPPQQPMLGGPLVDMPGGGTAPGQTQTAMLPPQGMALPPSVPPELLQALGPERGAAFLAEFYKPQTQANRQTAKDVTGRLRYLDTGDLAFPNVTPPVEEPEGPKPSDVASMRKEFSGQSKDYRSVRTAFSKVQETAKNPSAAGDLALIFNYMKMLDPGSVVREGEFATAQNTAGVPTQVRNVYNRLISGERLAPEQRQDFVNQAYNVYGAQASSQNLLEEQYRSLAVRSGYDPENVVIDYQGKFREMTPLGQFTTEMAGEGAGAPAQVSSQNEYDKLPSGAQYVAPDGKTRIKR